MLIGNADTLILTFYISAGASAVIPDRDGNTALHLCCKKGFQAAFHAILSAKSQPAAELNLVSLDQALVEWTILSSSETGDPVKSRSSSETGNQQISTQQMSQTFPASLAKTENLSDLADEGRLG